jgi:hypothetical protein
VPTRDRLHLAAFVELFERIGPRRIEQAVAREGILDLRCDERLGHQTGKALDNFQQREFGARRDRTGRLQAKGADKDRAAPQQHALGRGQKRVAPVERRPQGLVPR